MVFLNRVQLLFASLLLVGGLLIPTSTQAQLQEVQQTVFGMDCAPCAHAMETRLGTLEGVSDVSVSLNEGLATIELEADNTVTLGAIREAVVRAGFSAEGATIRLTGVLKEEDGQRVLATSAGETYVLDVTGDDVSVEGTDNGKRVAVIGRVPAGAHAAEAGWNMQVEHVEPTG